MSKLLVPSTDFTTEVEIGATNKGVKASGGSTVQMLKVDPAKINRIEGFNVRVETPDYRAHVEDIKESIKVNGWFEDKPMAGYIDKAGELFLTDGYTRHLAVVELIEAGVPVEAVTFVAKPQGQSLEDMTVALVVGNEGRPLSVFEKSIVVKRLQGYGVDNATIAQRLNMTERYVGDMLVLSGASPKVRKLVIDGKVSATEAVKQLRKDTKGAGDKLAAAVESAAAAGKKKATGKDVKKAAEPAEEPKTGFSQDVVVRGTRVTTVMNWNYKLGDIVPTDEMKAIRMLNDADWWNFVDEDKKDFVVIEEAVKIEVRLTQTVAKTDEQPADEPEQEVEPEFDSHAEPEAEAEAEEGAEEAAEDEPLTDEEKAALEHLDAVTTPAEDNDAAAVAEGEQDEL